MRKSVIGDLCKQHYRLLDDQAKAFMGNGASYSGIMYHRKNCADVPDDLYRPFTIFGHQVKT